MSAILNFGEGNSLRMVITSWSGRNSLDRDYQLFRQFSQPNRDSFFQKFLQSDTLVVQFDSSFDTTNVCTLKNYLTGATVATASATEVVDNTTYSVYEHTFTISALSGLYYVEVTGTDADLETFTAISEPIEIRASYACDTALIAYYNYEPAFGIDYRSGVTFNLRVPAIFNRISNTKETDPFTDTSGDISLISSIITRSRNFKLTEQVPQWIIEKINTALAHDYCTINGVRVSANQSLPYDVIGDRYLWAEAESELTLSSGSSDFRNIHDSNVRETL